MVAPLIAPGGPFTPPPPGYQPNGPRPPMPGMPGMPGMPSPSLPQLTAKPDPVALVQAMRTLAGTTRAAPKPIYRPGYKQPPKPDPLLVRAQANKIFDNHRLWRAMIATTLKWTRQDLTGMFPEDEEDRLNGFQEEYISSALSDERNLIISKGSSLTPAFRKALMKGDDRGWAQKLEDAAVWFRDEERSSHALRGNRPLELDEWAFLTDYGMYVSRDVLNPDNPECPIDSCLIDPAQVYPVWGKYGPERVYRVYRDTPDRIMAAYGEFSPATRGLIQKQFDREDLWTNQVEVPVTEYWDTWWRCVLVGDTEIVKVAAHEYGETPWTIQYGGMGDPMMTRNPAEGSAMRVNNQWVISEMSQFDERVNKAVPFIYYRIRSHEIYEAVMGRLLTGFKKEINPPMVRERTNAAADKPIEPLNLAPGMQNEVMLGEERLSPVPTAIGGPATQLILANLAMDKRTGAPPDAMYGQVDKSNVTGTALASLGDQGMDKLAPLIRPWEMALSSKYSRIFRTLRNFGHDVKYGATDEIRPLMVPVRKPKPQQPLAYELDRDTIDKAGGPKIVVSFTKVDPRDWMGLFNAGKIGVEGGFVTRAEVRSLAMGDHDWDRHLEEWMEEQALFQAVQLPEFAKQVTVPMAFLSQIKENAGSPEVQAMYAKLLQGWIESTKPPPMPPGIGQPGQPGQAPPMQQQAPAAPPPAPPSAAGVSYPQLGQGPGTQGGAVGRPVQYGA